MSRTMYARRRARLAKQLGEDTAVILRGAKEVLRNGDVHFPFRQDSDFRYLTGFNEPDATLLIVGGRSHFATLFCTPKDKTKMLWEDAVVGPRDAMRLLGVDEAHSNKDAGEMQKIIAARSAGKIMREDGASDLISAMRLIKETSEVTLMRKAANITALGHHELLHFARPGMYEHELEAALAFHYRRAGADALNAYPSIVASGKNALTLHYRKNNARIRSGDLVLVDAGCEYKGYASDVTRTFPISGTFSSAQRALYSIVLQAQEEAIETIAIGVTMEEVHDKACEVITEGLLRLGIIKASSLDVALMKQLYKPFFPHGTSHWLGMDVHDVGDYNDDPVTKRSRRKLECGMALTVEPGIYVRPNKSVPREYWNIGIRIEDDVLVTKRGCEVLSKKAPKEIDEIETVMSATHWW